MEILSLVIVPLVLCVCGLLLLFSKKDLYGAFSKGATEGAKTTFRLLPSLVFMCTASAMFTASGASEILTKVISPITDLLKIPSEIVPFLIVRPISGSASNSIICELFANYGVDSISGFTASVIAGSSDTLLYIVAVYFSAVNIKNTRYTVVAGVITMFCVIIFASILSRIFF